MKLQYKLLTRVLVNLLHEHLPWCIVLVGLSVLVAFCEGLSMVFIVTILDGGILKHFPSFLWPISHWLGDLTPVEKVRSIAFLVVGIAVFKGSVLYVYSRISTFLSVEITKLFRNKCITQLLSISMRYLHNQKLSDLFTITTSHTEGAGVLVGIVSSVIPKIFSSLILLLILIRLSYPLTIASMILMMVSSMFLRHLSKESGISGIEANKELLKFNQVVMSIIQGMKEIRLFNRSKQFAQKGEEHIGNYGRAAFRNAMVSTMVFPVFEVATAACLGIMLFFASIFLPRYYTNWLPTLLSFMIILFRLVMPAASMSHTGVLIASTAPRVKDLLDFLDRTGKDYIPNGQKRLNGFCSAVEFKNVTFRYHKDKILDDISFSIPKASKTAIVGPSGCGKTTVIELLLRFYDPQQGGIYVDGVDIRNLNIFSWRNYFGVVSQDTFLFNQSVRENISFAVPSAKFENIQEAARIAHADEFIYKMPNGYDTVLGERGVKVSGGQRQRLAIARAVLKDPEILVFDEATSALDSESEKIVQEALDEAGKNKTKIVIAHRLSTIFDADQIIVLDQGRIAQRGTHQKLIRQEGLYRKMVELQKMDLEYAGTKE